MDDDDENGHSISRAHLHVDQARERFLPAKVDAGDVDFSDRVTGKRKSYKTSSRRQRTLDDGTAELEDFSDDEGEEHLARKIARLKREVEEAKEEYGKQKAASTATPKGGESRELELETLSQVLDEISRLGDEVPRGAIQSARTAGTALPGEKGISQKSTIDHGASSSSVPRTDAPYDQDQPLAKAADFDRRLLLMERAVGIGSSAMPELDSSGLPRAIIPTLEALQKQISTLSEASTSSLDSISRRVRALIQEADQLEKSRRSAKAAHEALVQAGATPSAEATAPDDTEQVAKINALYGTLPTIENLMPLLPPLLDRLRSLRAIHADAATASETLDRIETRQADMGSDIKQWREGLEKVEAAMKQGESSIGGNMKVIEGWVKELEAKMAKLG